MKLKNLFAATALAAATTLSSAADVVVPLISTGPNLFGASFTQSSDTGFFTDTFEFAALPADGVLFVSLFSVLGPVEFFVADIAAGDSSQSFSFFPEDGPLDRVSFTATVAAGTPFFLTVLGAGTTLGTDGFPLGPVSYGGTLLAVVPELETYALMLLGLIGVGGMARRQQRAAQPSIA